MNPGLYYDTPADEYHRSPGISKSGLDAIRQSGFHYFWRYGRHQALDGAEDAAGAESDAFAELANILDELEREPDHLPLGSALHALILEGPKVFGARFSIAQPFSGRGSTAAKAAARAAAAERGQTLLSRDQGLHLFGMRQGIERKRVAQRLLAPEQGKPEVSMYWTDAVTGADCRGRIDFLRDDGVVVDLKTTRDASPEGFSKSLLTYRYHVQAAYYLDGLRALGHTPKAFVFVCVENRAPYEAAVYAIDQTALEIGRAEYRADLAEYQRHLSAGSWSGYPDRIQPISLPEWKLRQVEFAESK